MTFSPDTPLWKVRQYAMEGRYQEKGVGCPCCDQLCKVYPRKVYSTLARWTIALCRRYLVNPRWYGVREPWSLRILGGTGDVAKLQYYGFIEHKPKDPEDTHKKTSGLWRPRLRAFQFIKRRYNIEATALVYNAKLVGWKTHDPFDIVDALNEKFSYEELMNEEI